MDIRVEIQFQDGTRTYSIERLKYLETNSVFLDDINTPFLGVCCEDGQVEFYDRDSQFLQLAQSKLLVAGQPLKIFYKDLQLCNALTEKWDYKYGSGIVKVLLKSTLLEWNDKKLDTIPLQENSTALAFFNILNSASGNVVREANGSTINSNSAIGSHLASIPIRYFLREPSSLRDAWNELCDLAQLVIYKQINGTVTAVKVYG